MFQTHKNRLDDKTFSETRDGRRLICIPALREYASQSLPAKVTRAIEGAKFRRIVAGRRGDAGRQPINNS